MSRLEDFRDRVGSSGPVCVRGGGTRWLVGGPPSAGSREVRAPSGVVSFDPAEMTVVVGAGTPLTELTDALSEHDQEVALGAAPGATVGGVLAVGWSSLRRARIGSVRDALLQADCVGANGALFTAGGPTVKNVSGYDLCRLLVGSLGTLALIGQVILRTWPSPERTLWMQGPSTPEAARDACYRPSSLLWDGRLVSVCLEGYGADVAGEAAFLAANLGFSEMATAPTLPPHRSRWTGLLPEGGLLEVGSGVVHGPVAVDARKPEPGVAGLAARVRSGFDPEGRLNPGRDPYRIAA
ncbi:MAG: FAD-binding protein [Actinobacteria bacterium]|nr:FAD-binding protein [Actinomycetota bacterium]